MAFEVAVVLAVALAASALTLFTGFGLGTLLLAAFALVFPLEVAIAATAVVHLANNLWKSALLGRAADRATVVRFGVPAVLGAFVGAAALLVLERRALWTYELAGPREVTALGLVVGALVVGFALFDLVPRLRRLALPRRHLVVGGVLSGFFGGLSGHQGALRSVFLTKIGLDAHAFVATGVVCAVLVDVARLAVYAGRFATDVAAIGEAGGWPLLAGATLMALAGAVLGARLLRGRTLEGLRTLVGVALLAVGSLIAAGMV